MNNTRVFRFLSIALLAAIALYFAAQGYFALTDPFTTRWSIRAPPRTPSTSAAGWSGTRRSSPVKAAPCAMRSARANG